MAGVFLALWAATSSTALAATPAAGAADGPVQLLTELNFNSTTPLASSVPSAAIQSAVVNGITPAASGIDGWSIGAQNGGAVGVQATTGPDGTTVDALEGSYPQPAYHGGQYMWASYNVSQLNIEDVYIEFWAKMPLAKEGCKFVKVFGQRSPAGYGADTTIATDYTGADYGAIRQISFGDGTDLGNDSQNVININGTNPQWIGRSYSQQPVEIATPSGTAELEAPPYGTAVVETPQMSNFTSSDWGTGWHHFLIHIKFNSGTSVQNEVPNGEYFLEIDGKVYVDATGLYNRNPADLPINNVEFFGWAQTEFSPFQLWYYDIRISTGGFVSKPLPDPPKDVAIKP